MALWLLFLHAFAVVKGSTQIECFIWEMALWHGDPLTSISVRAKLSQLWSTQLAPAVSFMRSHAEFVEPEASRGTPIEDTGLRDFLWNLYCLIFSELSAILPTTPECTLISSMVDTAMMRVRFMALSDCKCAEAFDDLVLSPLHADGDGKGALGGFKLWSHNFTKDSLSLQQARCALLAFQLLSVHLLRTRNATPLRLGFAPLFSTLLSTIIGRNLQSVVPNEKAKFIPPQILLKRTVPPTLLDKIDRRFAHKDAPIVQHMRRYTKDYRRFFCMIALRRLMMLKLQHAIPWTYYEAIVTDESPPKHLHAQLRKIPIKLMDRAMPPMSIELSMTPFHEWPEDLQRSFWSPDDLSMLILLLEAFASRLQGPLPLQMLQPMLDRWGLVSKEQKDSVSLDLDFMLKALSCGLIDAFLRP
jgi:hypothetical protein